MGAGERKCQNFILSRENKIFALLGQSLRLWTPLPPLHQPHLIRQATELVMQRVHGVKLRLQDRQKEGEGIITLYIILVLQFAEEELHPPLNVVGMGQFVTPGNNAAIHKEGAELPFMGKLMTVN